MMYEPRLILISLLIKLGIAAAVSSALARSRVFKRLLFAEDRTAGETIGLLAFICIPLTLGVWARVTVPNFLAADIAFETTVILGVLLGPWWAAGGRRISRYSCHAAWRISDVAGRIFAWRSLPDCTGGWWSRKRCGRSHPSST